MSVNLFSHDFMSVGFDRGGSIKKIKDTRTILRIKPCRWPINNFVISYDGTVYPCCQFFHGFDMHKQYQVGNVVDKTIFDYYMSQYLIAFRKRAVKEGIKPEPCKFCLL
jgi:radical SAM protein with 4Fe4S-binding SPASM domain